MRPFQRLIPGSFTPLACILFCWCLALLALLPATVVKAAGDQEQAVTGYRIKIRKLQEGINNQELLAEATREQEMVILEELEILDKRLSEQKSRLDELHQKVAQQSALIEREETALTKLRKEKEVVQTHLQRRITAYYTMGDIGLLNVTFSTQTLPELMRFHDNFSSLIKYDQGIIKVYKETIADLEKTRQSLSLEKEILQDFVTEKEKEAAALESTKTEKNGLLTQVRTQTKLHQQAIDEMTRASQKLADSITSIKTRQELRQQTFLNNKGNLPPPVDGILVTLFGDVKNNKLGVSRQSAGIELSAPDGTTVLAVSDGEVIFSGYLRGYGNTIIIDHGFEYFTVTSRMEKLLAVKGQTVSREQVIGVMGEMATLFEHGLYFEIRHSKTPLDPLLWLNPNRLATPHEADRAAVEELPESAPPQPAIENL